MMSYTLTYCADVMSHIMTVIHYLYLIYSYTSNYGNGNNVYILTYILTHSCVTITACVISLREHSISPGGEHIIVADSSTDLTPDGEHFLLWIYFYEVYTAALQF